MARVQVINQTTLNTDPEPTDWTLWFQWCRYLYDDGAMQHGYVSSGSDRNLRAGHFKPHGDKLEFRRSRCLRSSWRRQEQRDGETTTAMTLKCQPRSRGLLRKPQPARFS